MDLNRTGFGITTVHELKPDRTAARVATSVLPDPLEPLPFSQRRGRRTPAEGWSVARVVDSTGERALVGVKYRDASAGGLGLEIPMALEVGSDIVLHWQGQSTPSRFGTVRWCRAAEGDEGTFHIGVECGSPVAAAG